MYAQLPSHILFPLLISFQSRLLDQWTQYLIEDSLIPGDQVSTDDFAGALANQTNLAIKGIVGIKAMSVVWGLLGNTAQESNYTVGGITHLHPVNN